jgi:hypothetical protein
VPYAVPDASSHDPEDEDMRENQAEGQGKVYENHPPILSTAGAIKYFAFARFG